ncbi:MAG: hypothetical protein AAF800_04370 [Planctomycetota bacterium]
MTKTLLAGAEVWQRPPGASRPEIDNAIYPGLDGLAEAVTEDGLKAQNHPLLTAFDDLQPRIVEDLSDFGFLVKEAAEMVGVKAAVIWPAYSGDAVSSVLVLYLRGGENHRGAAELWSGTKGRFELSLAGGYFSGLDRFARVSRYVNFPMGAGLPGVCWEKSAAKLVPDVGAAKGFLRSAGEGDERLTVGLGLPLLYRTDLRSVLVLLSSVCCPVASVQEIWVQDPEAAGRIVRSQGVYHGHVALAEASQSVAFTPGEGLIGRAWSTARSQLVVGEGVYAELGEARTEATREAGLTFAVAIPVAVIGSVNSAVLLMG